MLGDEDTGRPQLSRRWAGGVRQASLGTLSNLGLGPWAVSVGAVIAEHVSAVGWPADMWQFCINVMTLGHSPRLPRSAQSQWGLPSKLFCGLHPWHLDSKTKPCTSRRLFFPPRHIACHPSTGIPALFPCRGLNTPPAPRGKPQSL